MQGTRRYGSEEADPIDWIVPPGRASDEPGIMSAPGLSEMFAYHATTMANTIRTSLLVFTRMVSFLFCIRRSLHKILPAFHNVKQDVAFCCDTFILMRAILQGNMPALLSHYRPDFPIFCFTEDETVQRRLALYHGVTSLRMRFGEAADETFERQALCNGRCPAIALL